MKKLLLLSVVFLSAGFLRADLAGWFGKAKEAITEKDLSKAGKVFTQGATYAGKAKEYPADTKISFEVKNKSKKPVHVMVKSGDTVVEEAGVAIFTVPEKTTKGLTVDIEKDTVISLWREDKPESVETDAELKYSVPKNKTIYLTFDGSVLRPQTGPGQGKLGMTDTGLSIRNNVMKTDVKKV